MATLNTVNEAANEPSKDVSNEPAKQGRRIQAGAPSIPEARCVPGAGPRGSRATLVHENAWRWGALAAVALGLAGCAGGTGDESDDDVDLEETTAEEDALSGGGGGGGGSLDIHGIVPKFVLRVTAGQFNTQQKLALRFSTEFNGFEAWPDAWDKYHLYNQNNAQVLLKHAPENGGGWVKFETCDCIRPFDWSTQPLKVVGRSSSTVSTRGRVGDEVTVTGWFDLRESKLDKGLSLIADTVPDPSRTLKFTFRRRT